VSHARTDLLQDKLDRQSSPLEDGFAHHHVLAFLDVVLSLQSHRPFLSIFL
jgi:hypothetical protein